MTTKYKNKFHAGQMFGKWTVITGNVWQDDRSRAYVELKCTCGSHRNVECSSLARGRTTKCSDCNYSYDGRGGHKNPHWKGSNFVPKTVSDRVAKRSGLTHTISPQLLEGLYMSQSGICPLTGEAIIPTSANSYVAPIDNSVSYTAANMAWVSPTIGQAAMTYGVNGLRALSSTINNHSLQSLGFRPTGSITC